MPGLTNQPPFLFPRDFPPPVPQQPLPGLQLRKPGGWEKRGGGSRAAGRGRQRTCGQQLAGRAGRRASSRGPAPPPVGTSAVGRVAPAAVPTAEDFPLLGPRRPAEWPPTSPPTAPRPAPPRRPGPAGGSVRGPRGWEGGLGWGMERETWPKMDTRARDAEVPAGEETGARPPESRWKSQRRRRRGLACSRGWLGGAGLREDMEEGTIGRGMGGARLGSRRGGRKCGQTGMEGGSGLGERDGEARGPASGRAELQREEGGRVELQVGERGSDNRGGGGGETPLRDPGWPGRG